jgi:hypothetical protein
VTLPFFFHPSSLSFFCYTSALTEIKEVIGDTLTIINILSCNTRESMPSPKRKNEYEKYLSALNDHKMEEALTFYDNNCEVKFGHETVAKGIEQIRAAFIISLSDPNYSYELIQYLSVDGDDQLRVRLKRYDNKQLDVTFTFSKENPQKYDQLFITFIDG